MEDLPISPEDYFTAYTQWTMENTHTDRLTLEMLQETAARIQQENVARMQQEQGSVIAPQILLVPPALEEAARTHFSSNFAPSPTWRHQTYTGSFALDDEPKIVKPLKRKAITNFREYLESKGVVE